MIDPHWYRNFFYGVALECWRQACPPPQTGAEVDLVERLFELQEGARLLDVPCGLGRHSLELAAGGCRPCGVDLSREALGELKREAKRRALPVEVVRADMCCLPWGPVFDGALCLGNSFGYFDPDLCQAFLQGVCRALKPEAGFLLDTGGAAESLLPTLDERNWYRVGELTLLVENDHRVAESCLETRYTFVTPQGEETRSGRQYVFTVGELERMFRRAGLEVCALFGSTEMEPFQVGSPRLLLLARKRGQPELEASAQPEKGGAP